MSDRQAQFAQLEEHVRAVKVDLEAARSAGADANHLDVALYHLQISHLLTKMAILEMEQRNGQKAP